MSDRLALIIANSEFDDPKLTRLATPSRDAEALAEALSDPKIGGFQVTKLVNKPLRAVRREISRLYRRRKRSDLLLLYYSGHGFKDDYGELYLAVRDTEHETLDATALEAAFVRGRLDKSGSQRKVVILDCCHSGAFGAKNVLGTSVGTQEALIGSGYGVVILTATDAVQYAWERDRVIGDTEESVFTHFLVQGLQTGSADLDRDGNISHDELYKYVYEQVLRSGVTKQTPLVLAPRVEGQIIVARNPKAVVQSAELPPELKQAVESPFVGIREGAVRELGRLLRGDDKVLALAAQRILEKLVNDSNHSVSAAAARALGIDASTPERLRKRGSVPAGIESRLGDKELAPAPTGVERVSVAPTSAHQPFEPEMILIPAGEFLMGSDPKKDRAAKEDEQPQHTVYLPDFYLAKTTVTNAQYLAFVQATGHHRPKHWQDGKLPSGKEDHPVIRVTWRDAVVYCNWLAEVTGKPYRLPSEAEWEKGARGTDGRIYPWGDQKPRSIRCNFGENVNDTTRVGAYPKGASPYGLLDMAGNVWEWTSSLYKNYPYQADDGRENLDASGVRVRRGGFWASMRYHHELRSAFRYGRLRSDFYYFIRGFRCCVSPTSLSP